MPAADSLTAVWLDGVIIYEESVKSWPTGITVHNGEVFVSGAWYKNPTTCATCYWKNGVRVPLVGGDGSSGEDILFIP
jgi:hypothetical protein